MPAIHIFSTGTRICKTISAIMSPRTAAKNIPTNVHYTTNASVGEGYLSALASKWLAWRDAFGLNRSFN